MALPRLGEGWAGQRAGYAFAVKISGRKTRGLGMKTCVGSVCFLWNTLSLQEKQPPEKPNAECLFLSPEIFIISPKRGDGMFPIPVPDPGRGPGGDHAPPCLRPRSLLTTLMLLGGGTINVLVGEGPHRRVALTGIHRCSAWGAPI